MTFAQFLEWVAGQDLDQLQPDLVLSKVTVVLETLQESDPRYAWMAVIEDTLLDGVLPRDRLMALADRFPGPQSIEGRLRQRAGQATPRQWETQSILRLRGCLQRLDDDPAPLQSYLAWMQEQLKILWQQYDPGESAGGAEELEKVAGQLLREAYHDWQKALLSVGRGDFEGGLELAIKANRLLVALHDLDERPL